MDNAKKGKDKTPGREGKRQKSFVNPGIFCKYFVDFFQIVLIIVFRMDMQKSVSDAKQGIPADLSRHKLVVGAKQLRKALRAGTVQQAYLAENADPAITEPLAVLCQENSVEVSWVGSMSALGKACGIEVGTAAAAIVA